ncbi:unnamed protein product [Rotaria socialis]|uniref:HMA domain-containing protein n=2 Tax=Rotaria socialis TaxID=392032 RepID=A0A818M1Y4_9BILA|nr:unnamed protein product [Rotaria socialis]CAF3179995.1 unnamed protein product [Rotaria socialis]CAF3337904.1 unnamed protein product [Rotaria socialis]CAF3388119.1 unnamed protein product [Rotaria socialis]CAF3581145.1 unnamed protein product [Rotaria socialis]
MSSITKKVFNVDGMTCQSCVKNIERNVGKMDGVKTVVVSLNDKNASVEFGSDKTTEQAIIEKITSLGFQAKLK